MLKKDRATPLYVISAVADILGVHPQTLRLYEREGFICPTRHNNQRKYSEDDISRLNFVLELTRDMGVNKAGVDIILRLRQRLEALQSEVEDMMLYMDEERRRQFRDRIKRIFQEGR